MSARRLGAIARVVLLMLWLGESVGLAGPFRFTNVTASSRFFSLRMQGGHGIQAADATGDGFPELYATHIFAPNEDRPDLFFVNLGDGSFREEGTQRGVADDGFFGRASEESHAAVFADLDNDGDYDLFNAHTWSGNHKLYRNDGAGSFTDVSAAAGIEIDSGEPRGVAAGDINGDGLYDIVVSAWENLPMTLYLGRGGLRFERRSLGRLGAKLANQGIVLTDYDGDGDLDLATTGHIATNAPIGPIALLENDGAGNFRDRTAESGIRFDSGGDGVNGWSFGDLDTDGDLDAVLVSKDTSRVFLNVGGGRFRLQQELGRGNSTAALGDFDHDGDLDLYVGGSEAIFDNDGSARFTLTQNVGITGLGADARGAAVLDFDRDGDLDIVVVSKRGANTLLRNDRGGDGFIQVELVGPPGDAGAFGAKVFVYEERHVDEPDHLVGFREARGATGYCSQNEPLLHFGVTAGRVYEVKAEYPDGSFVIAKGVRAPARLRLDARDPLAR